MKAMALSPTPDASPTTGGGPRAKGARTKAKILDAAVDLYAERGFRGTGLAAIGAAAGVSHAAVLYHFGSSEQLLVAVLDERLRRFAAATREASSSGASSGEEIGPRAIIERLPAVARFNVDHAGLTRLYVVLRVESLEPDSPTHSYFVRHRRRARKLYAGALAEGVATGVFRDDLDVEATADTIVAFLGGAEIDWLLDPDRVDLVALTEAFTARLLDDLCQQSGSCR